MSEATATVTIRPLSELDIEAIVEIDERVNGTTQSDEWGQKVMYYIRRDPEIPAIAIADGQVIGFMLGEVRAGEFGLEDATGWIEIVGVDPDFQGKAVGKQLVEEMATYLKRKGVNAIRTMVNEETHAGLATFFGNTGFETEPVKSFVRTL